MGFAGNLRKSIGPELAGIGKAAGLAIAGSGLLSMAAPIGAAGLALGAFAAVAAPTLDKVKKALTSTGKAGQKAWAALDPAQTAIAHNIQGLQKSFGQIAKAAEPLVVEVTSLALTLARDLLPALGPMAKAGATVIADFLKPLDALLKSSTFAQFTATVSQFATKIGPTLGTFLTSLIKILMQLFIQLMPAGVQILKALLPALSSMLTSLVPIIALIAQWTAAAVTWLARNKLLVPALWLLVGAFAALKLELLTNPFTAIALGVVVLTEIIIRYHKQIWNAITGTWNAIRKFLAGLWNGLPGPLKNTLKAIGGMWKAEWDLMIGALKVAWAVITAVFKAAWDYIAVVFKVTLALLTGNWTAAWNAIRNYGIQIWNILRSTASAVWNAMKSAAVSAWNATGAAFRSIWNAIRATAAAIWNSIWANTVSAAANGTRSVVSWVGTLPGRIGNIFRGAQNWLFGHGRDIINGLLNGITSVMSGISGWIKNRVVDPVINAVKHFFGIRSPSTVFAGIGAHLVNGMIMGLITGSKGLSHVIGSVFGDMPKALLHLIEKGLIGVSSLPSKAMKALGGLGGAIGSFFTGGSGGAGVARWGGDVLRALGMLGLPAGLAGSVLYQMRTESGGNPFAQNNWDINAARGDPSRGLMQVIGSTFARFHVPGTSSNIFDPLANIAAALNYAAHGRGFGGGAGQLGSGHGYAAGGPTSAGWAVTGEHGRELIKVPGGATVVPHGASEQALAAGGQIQVVLQVQAGSRSEFDELMLRWLKEKTRVLGGGSVQTAFGRS